MVVSTRRVKQERTVQCKQGRLDQKWCEEALISEGCEVAGNSGAVLGERVGERRPRRGGFTF